MYFAKVSLTEVAEPMTRVDWAWASLVLQFFYVSSGREIVLCFVLPCTEHLPTAVLSFSVSCLRHFVTCHTIQNTRVLSPKGSR